MIQLMVCLWAFCQHFYSILVFDEILHCDFENSTDAAMLTAVDAIIFDIGLFHSLWGIQGCVAQHLDGGYGRFAWCICHIGALLFCLPFAFASRPKPFYLWPLLIQQSAYGIGLLILSLAALPRILPTFMGDLENAPLVSILAYMLGIFMNFFLLVVLWHWYWHVESMWDSARKVRNDQLERIAANRKPRPPVVTPPKKFSAEMQEKKSFQLLSNGNTVTRKGVPLSNGIPPKKTNGELPSSMLLKQVMLNPSPTNLSAASSRVSSLIEEGSIKHDNMNPSYPRKNTMDMLGYSTQPLVYQNEYSSDEEEYLEPLPATRNTIALDCLPQPYGTNYSPLIIPNDRNGSIANPHLRLSSIYSLMQPSFGKASPCHYVPQQNACRNYLSLQDYSPRTDL
uniref:Uncharacterized protein n=1 Tax=Acrobeloides nanus TaxID=290746 RepID=A0A914EAF8_9BILA